MERSPALRQGEHPRHHQQIRQEHDGKDRPQPVGAFGIDGDIRVGGVYPESVVCHCGGVGVVCKSDSNVDGRRLARQHTVKQAGLYVGHEQLAPGMTQVQIAKILEGPEQRHLLLANFNF